MREGGNVIYCNNEQCQFNNEQQCTNDKVYYINRLCVTYRHKARQENYQDLMKSPYSPKCHRKAGKYKSDHGDLIK